MTICPDHDADPDIRLGGTADTAASRVGVVLFENAIDIDAILRAASDALRERGVVVGGVLQRFGERLSNGKRSMWLDDIAGGQTVRLDRPRGPGAISCVLDPDALVQCACLLRDAIASGAELLVVNRFGTAEAEGQGMRAEFAEAICSGAAVLVAVRPNLLAELERFLGAPAQILPASAPHLAAWAEGRARGRQAMAA